MEEREDKICCLEAEITDLTNSLAVKDSENVHHMQSVRLMQDSQHDYQLQVSSEIVIFH